jgi:hypothetical protein
MKFITFFVLFIVLTYADPTTTVTTPDESSWEYTSIPLSEVNTDEDFYNLLECGSQKVILMTMKHYELTDLTFTTNVHDISTYTFNCAQYYKFKVTLVNGQGITIEATFVVKSENGDSDLFSYKYNVIIPAGVEVKSDCGEHGNGEEGNEYTHEEVEEEEEEEVEVVEENPVEERDKEEEGEEFEEEETEVIEANPVEETTDDTISSTCKVIPNCKSVMVPGQGFKNICTYQTVCF